MTDPAAPTPAPSKAPTHSPETRLLLDWWLAPLATIAIFVVFLFGFFAFRCLREYCCDDGSEEEPADFIGYTSSGLDQDMNDGSYFTTPNQSPRGPNSARPGEHDTVRVRVSGVSAADLNALEQQGGGSRSARSRNGQRSRGHSFGAQSIGAASGNSEGRPYNIYEQSVEREDDTS
jgi:hypothetical protein